MPKVVWGRPVSQPGDLAGEPTSVSGYTGGTIVSGHLIQADGGSGVHAVISGTLTTLSGQRAVISGTIDEGAVVPGNLASGAVESGTVGIGAIVSGNIASGQVGGVILARYAATMTLTSGETTQAHDLAGAPSIYGFTLMSGTVASGAWIYVRPPDATNLYIYTPVSGPNVLLWAIL